MRATAALALLAQSLQTSFQRSSSSSSPSSLRCAAFHLSSVCPIQSSPCVALLSPCALPRCLAVTPPMRFSLPRCRAVAVLLFTLACRRSIVVADAARTADDGLHPEHTRIAPDDATHIVRTLPRFEHSPEIARATGVTFALNARGESSAGVPLDDGTDATSTDLLDDPESFLQIQAMTREREQTLVGQRQRQRVGGTSGDKYVSSHPPMDRCQICTYVLERIKEGYQYLLPSICLEVYSKQNTGEGEVPYQICHHVLYSLNVWGNNVRHWFQFGCYKSESYGAMEVIRPCPSHIICSQLGDMKKVAFCDNLKQDKLEPGK